MSGVCRVGMIRILGRQQPLLFAQTGLPAAIQKRNIFSKSLRCGAPPKPKPWPYKEKNYGILQAFFDKTLKRIDENSKMIVVEGPPAAGKTKLAQELANELDMHFVPFSNLDSFYINMYGYDMRQLDSQMPESCKSFDVTNFCRNPNHRNVACFQMRMYMQRYWDYVDALAHILSTGQGVVMERCPYSDFVFVEAMLKHGFISKGAYSVYQDIKRNTIAELLKPHLVIYLDVPVNIVKERIAARNLSHEINSPALTDAYLNDLEAIYKQQYLKDISIHAELLVYDWSDEGEPEIVVEDVERIDFDEFEKDRHNKKMKDWRMPQEWDWCAARMKFASDKDEIMNFFNVPRFDVPELLRTAEEGKLFREVWYSAPGMQYRHGYNKEMGDTGILTKMKLSRRLV